MRQGEKHPMYGKQHREESILKNRLSQRNRKRVYQYNKDMSLVAIYNSIHEAAKELNVYHSTVSKWCKGLCKPKNDFVWIVKGGA